MSSSNNIAAAVAALSPEQRAALLQALAGPPEGIAIVGVGCRLPAGAQGPEGLWSLLSRGVDGIREIPADRWDVDALYDPDPNVAGKMSTRWGSFLDDVRGFDEGYFKISPREASAMDPQQRIMLEVVVEALEDAAAYGPQLAGSRTGVYVGVSAVEYALLGWPLTSIDAYASSGTSKSILANRISYQFDLRGPSLAVDTACSSSLVAAHLACRSLRSKETDLALVGGVNVIVAPTLSVSYSKWGMMAPDGRCKTFDAKADGFVRGEGCGVVVLKRLSDAQAAGDRIYAVIRGSAINQDGKSAGLTAPNLEAQIGVIKEALKDARLSPEQISYVEAHGTGTALGDPIEIEALAEALKGSGTPCAIGSIKTNLGHLEGAAGIAGLLKLALALRHRSIPPHLHLETVNPKLHLERTPFRIPRALEPWSGSTRRVGAVSSFGFGGTNAHLILEEAPTTTPPPAQERSRVLALSAATPAALRARIEGYAARLEARPEDFAALAEVNLRRGHRHLHRAGIVAVTGQEAALALRSLLDGPPSPYAVTPREARRRAPKLAFVMTGQGSAWVGMGQRLLLRVPMFRSALAELDGTARPILGWSVLEALERADPSLLSTERAQPAIFLLQLGLVRWLAAYRIEPAAVVGHSVGELSAAVVAGALTLQDALRIIRLRAAIMAPHEGQGGMIEVARPAEELEPTLEGSTLAVAAVNRRSATVIAGPKDDLERFSAQQRGQGVVVRPLDVGCAFHGRALRAEAPRLVQALGALAGSSPRVPLYSTVTGGLAPDLDAAYFGRNLGDPVLFAPAIERMAQDGVDLFLELGPHASLTRDLDAILGAPRAIASLLRGRDDELRADAALLALECEGVVVDWSPRTKEVLAPVSPPLYPWQHQSRWGTGAQTSRPNTDLGHPLLKEQILTPDLSRRVFELALDSEIVTQHRFAGQALFPTVGVVEAARAAAAKLGVSRSGVAELTVLRPLLARPGEGQRAQLILGPADDFEVVASVDPAAGAPWNVYFRGRYGEVTPPASIPTIPLPGPGGNGVDYYAELSRRGADFGAYFRRVEAWSSEPGRARAQLDSATKDPEAITAGLDVALHLYWAALSPERRPEHGGYLPVAFESIGVHGPLDQARWAEVQIREQSPERMLADAGLYDAEGRPLLSFRGIHYRPAELPGAELERIGRQDLYLERWESSEVAAAPKPGPWLVIGEGPVVAAARAELQAAGAELVADPAGARVLDLSAWGQLSPDPQVYLQSAALQAAQLLSRGPKEWVRVTERAVALPGELGTPAVAALDALMAVARLEQPQVRVRGIDADALSTALQAGLHSDLDRLVLRQGRSWVPQLLRAPLPLTPVSLRGDASYVISGGGGGLGLAIARDFLARGARSLWLLGRTPLSEAELTVLRQGGAEVQFRSVDVGDRAAVAAFWDETRGQVDGIVHAAGVVEDQRLDQLEATAIDRVLGAKVSGLLHLDQVSAQQPLSFLVAVSSAAGILGGLGQAAYAVANAYLDAHCARRRAEGRPFYSVAFGPFASAGMAARLGAVGQQRAAALGVQALDPALAGPLLLSLGSRDRTLVLRADWERLLAGRGDLQSPYYGRLRAPRGGSTVDQAFLSELRAAPGRVRSGLMLARIRHQLAAVLAVDRPDSIPSDVGLFELGLDSMTAVELTEGLQAKLGARLPATLVFEQPTLEALSQHLLAQLAPPEVELPHDELTGKSEDELIRLLEQELNAEGVGG